MGRAEKRSGERAPEAFKPDPAGQQDQNREKNPSVLIRHSEAADLPEILRVYSAARAYMKASGNPTQWGDTHPDPRIVEEDIRLKRSYIITSEGRVCGIFMILKGIEPTYLEIDGAWPDEEPYVTIHRIAGDGSTHGLMKACLDYVALLAKEHPEETGGPIRSIRMDTHENNKTMQHLLLKNGFRYCGIILLENGSPRLAYQKEL